MKDRARALYLSYILALTHNRLSLNALNSFHNQDVLEIFDHQFFEKPELKRATAGLFERTKGAYSKKVNSCTREDKQMEFTV